MNHFLPLELNGKQNGALLGPTDGAGCGNRGWTPSRVGGTRDTVRRGKPRPAGVAEKFLAEVSLYTLYWKTYKLGCKIIVTNFEAF